MTQAPWPAHILRDATNLVAASLQDRVLNQRTGQVLPCLIVLGTGGIVDPMLPRPNRFARWQLIFAKNTDVRMADLLTDQAAGDVYVAMEQDDTPSPRMRALSIAQSVYALQARKGDGTLVIPINEAVEFMSKATGHTAIQTINAVPVFMQQAQAVQESEQYGLTESEWAVIADSTLRYRDGTEPARGDTILWAARITPQGQLARLPITKRIDNLWGIPFTLYAVQDVNY